MKKLFFLLIPILFFSCSGDDNKLEFIVMNINDVYEIGALEGGESGGLARISYLYKKLKEENPNTILVHGGDFLNPSLLCTLKDENGDRYRGKQMIEVMNAVGFDLVAFGNHEFDLNRGELQKRFNESTFQWIGTNVQLNENDKLQPFYIEKDGLKENIPRTVVFDFKDKNGTEIKVGFFSSTINSNPQTYVDYGDLYQDAINAYKTLEPKTDVVLGLTHLAIAQDKMIANSLPNVPLILGGHEHTNMLVPVGDVLISKADANAKTAYVHRITYNKLTKETTIDSELIKVDASVDEDASIAKIVEYWNTILNEQLKEVIVHPNDVIYNAVVPLDGRDVTIRSQQTNLGQIIAASMSQAFNDEVDCAIVNGGSIRIDDELQGVVTGVDVFRVLPFGGGIYKVEIKGDLLERTLQYGRLKAGTGAYLQLYNAEYDVENKLWKIGGNPIDKLKTYTIAITDYLLLGFDIPFLKSDADGIVRVYQNKPDGIATDIRKVVIDYLKSNNSSNLVTF